ncbi:hypothetical protein [Streptomyces filamentosus]|uniref:hypothetical protein n=1 Tax=Streptomyces filamentosus TaxID=67294 RepID=UPI0033F9CE44
MRKTTERRVLTRLTACAAAVLLAGTAACSADGDTRADATARPATPAAACTYTWSGVQQRDVLTGVAEEQVFGEGGGRLTRPLKRVHNPSTGATTETGPEAGAKDVLLSLAAHLEGTGTEAPFDRASFVRAGRPAPALDGNTTATSGAGTLVAYAFVRQVTGDYRRTCTGGKPSTGSATSWTTEGSGVLDCKEPSSTFDEGEPSREAALRSCPPGSPAARS